MKKYNKLLMIGFTRDDLTDELWARLDGLVGEQVQLPKDSKNIVAQLANTDALFVKLGATVDQAQMDQAPQLKYIGMYGTGYGRIDTAYAAIKGITVCNIADYATEGVAEFGFAAILAYLRELERGRRQASAGDYSEATFDGTEIRDKFFGVLGLGDIGRRTAEIALGFGAQVGYWSRNRKPECEGRGIKFYEIDDLLSRCNFLSLNLALVDDTDGFMNHERVAKLKPRSVLLNLSPMELIDLAAVEDRLSRGDITLILDHSDEMRSEDVSRLAALPNCIIYPPIAYTTKEATLAKQRIQVDNIENALKGTPTNKVN